MKEPVYKFQNEGGVIRVPFLIKGSLLMPQDISRDEIEAAFKGISSETSYLKLPAVQLIRERVINRRTMSYAGGYAYQVLPLVKPQDVIEPDIDKLVSGLYALSAEDVLDYLDSLNASLNEDPALAEVQELYRSTTFYPDAFVEDWFKELSAGFNKTAARAMIDGELSLWGKPGSEFLNGWVEVPGPGWQGLSPEVGGVCPGRPEALWDSDRKLIRAMPTRQLHITAGNTPDVPLISALRAILTKSAAVIKMPFGATLTGGLLALAAVKAAPFHPITQNMSVIYWQGGDAAVEEIIFRPGAFDRIVVWGDPTTVASVQSQAAFTRTIYFNPRFGVSLIGKEAFTCDLAEVVSKAASDSLIYNQQSCSSSLVHYVEGSSEQVDGYARELCTALSMRDSTAPGFVPPASVGQLKRLHRGKYSSARWHLNMKGDTPVSGVAVIDDEFDILDHPLNRLVVVRPVGNLADALKFIHPGVSCVGIYPEEKRDALRDSVLARGVSSVLPLGGCGRVYAGMPHDGMLVLSQLVDWKNA